uniref:Uncharacterized protein n=1 Tax=Sphaerodactylus townsendi TaxID=933632 RepID=A0ACB8FF37_9SAUR
MCAAKSTREPQVQNPSPHSRNKPAADKAGLKQGGILGTAVGENCRRRSILRKAGRKSACVGGRLGNHWARRALQKHKLTPPPTRRSPRQLPRDQRLS